MWCATRKEGGRVDWRRRDTRWEEGIGNAEGRFCAGKSIFYLFRNTNGVFCSQKAFLPSGRNKNKGCCARNTIIYRFWNKIEHFRSCNSRIFEKGLKKIDYCIPLYGGHGVLEGEKERGKEQREMKSEFDKESLCAYYFGKCWHLWTPEAHPIIFESSETFKAGMNIFAICAKMFPNVVIYTFALMSNHVHITASGNEEELRQIFAAFRGFLKNNLKPRGIIVDLSRFECRLRRITDLYDFRNVIIYNNRNGYLVNPDETPFSYPWGANRYYFNSDAKELVMERQKEMGVREKRLAIRSHAADKTGPIMTLNGYACPLDFCAIKEGEAIFRDASQYFYLLSKNIESNKKIAQELSENIFCTDDELFAIACKLSMEKFSRSSPKELSGEEKMSLAKVLHFEYNAGCKQLNRILKISESVLQTFFSVRKIEGEN